MDCPRCGKSCFKPASEVLDQVPGIYMACPHCAPLPAVDHTAPRSRCKIHHLSRCEACNKAPLDLVMMDALEVLVDEGLRDRDPPLRSVGTPLVTVGYPLPFVPRLGKDSLILLTDRIDSRAAARLLRIPEIKGVIRGTGVPGVAGPNAKGLSWELLAGCDLRSDVIQSIFGELLIYRSQSQVHIEFSRKDAPKIRRLEGLPLSGRFVVDATCGPGTLGLTAALAGSKRVVLNDIWLPAVENTMMNLEANRDVLGIDCIEWAERPNRDALVGDEPLLVGSASGSCDFQVYHGDLYHLFPHTGSADIVLVDPFPGMSFSDLQKGAWAKEIVII